MSAASRARARAPPWRAPAQVSSNNTSLTESTIEDEEEEGIEPTHTHIDSLTNFGVQNSDLKKLKEAGVATADAVLRITKRKLESIKGISTAKAEKLIDAARNVAKRPCFQTAKDLQTDRDAHVVKITTGCADLDLIFNGGIESGSLTELYGEYRTGKTQLCLTLCVTSFLPRSLSGGAPRAPAPLRARAHRRPPSLARAPRTGEGRALYLDTEGTFRPERLLPIAARYELDQDFVMENVMHARVFNCDHLEELLRDAAALFADADGQGGPFRVLVIDSIIALYRHVRARVRGGRGRPSESAHAPSAPRRAVPCARARPQEFIGRGELAERQQRIGKVLAQVKELAEIYVRPAGADALWCQRFGGCGHGARGGPCVAGGECILSALSAVSLS